MYYIKYDKIIMLNIIQNIIAIIKKYIYIYYQYYSMVL